MNKMLDNIVNLIQQTQAQRDNLQAQVEKLVGEVSIVGEGDLRIQAEVTNNALGVLADLFNYRWSKIGSLIVRVKSVALEVEVRFRSFNRMMHLVEADNNQINQINLAAISVERMADASHQVASTPQVLYGVRVKLSRVRDVGANQYSRRLKGLVVSAPMCKPPQRRCKHLVSVHLRSITSLMLFRYRPSDQSSALDAAIQAAMAVRMAKASPAVAADIRRLAERANLRLGYYQNVRSVREDIGAVAVSMQDTERETSVGATLTEEAGAALLSIFSAVEQQAKEINSINQVTAQQVQTSNDIVTIMRRVSDGTQQSSIETREASQNMERLARLAKQFGVNRKPSNYTRCSSYSSPPPELA